MNRREYTRVGGGVEGSTRVGDPVWADWRSQGHGAERAGQSRRVPTDRPWRGPGRWSPRRRERGDWDGAGEHGRRWTRFAPGSPEGPHGDAP